jgi:hypothetical protein
MGLMLYCLFPVVSVLIPLLYRALIGAFGMPRPGRATFRVQRGLGGAELFSKLNYRIDMGTHWFGRLGWAFVT